MTGHRVGATALILAAALTVRFAAAQAPPQPQERAPVFRAGADVVTVDASVQNDRRPVTGLKAADFQLLDNGVAQEISEVAYEKLPIDVTLLLDVSASVTGPVLDELRRALRQVRTDLAAGDRMRLITFNMGISRLVDFDRPASEIDDALATLRGSGSSAVFDGLAVALTTADTPWPAAIDCALQRWTGQQQRQRRRHAPGGRQTKHADRRHHPRFAVFRAPGVAPSYDDAAGVGNRGHAH